MQTGRATRQLVCSLAVAFASALLALVPSAAAAPKVTLRASLTPDRPGTSTTVGFGFSVMGRAGSVPPPLRQIAVRLPPGLAFITSDLGTEAHCEPSTLLAGGTSACPPNAKIGTGGALVEVPFGPTIIHESATIAVFMGPPNPQHVEALLFAEGISPVAAQFVFPTAMFLEPSGILLTAALPLIPSLPEAPDVSVTSFDAEIGPRHLTYYHEVDGNLVAFQPTGLVIPHHCPRGGFPFVASFTFQDHSRVIARHSAPCPQVSSGVAKGRHRHGLDARAPGTHYRDRLVAEL